MSEENVRYQPPQVLKDGIESPLKRIGFETSDLSLAAFLSYKGHKLRTVYAQGNGKRLRNNKVFFVFEKSEDLEKDVVNYVNSEFSKFDAKVRELKKIAHTVLRSRGERYER